MEENAIQTNGGITINIDMSVKNINACEKDYIWSPATCSFENGKYLTIIMDDSAITCAKIIESYDEETKTIPTNFEEVKATCKTQNFYVLLAFLLITIALLITVNIYCYLIKYRAKKSSITISQHK